MQCSEMALLASKVIPIALSNQYGTTYLVYHQDRNRKRRKKYLQQAKEVAAIV